MSEPPLFLLFFLFFLLFLPPFLPFLEDDFLDLEELWLVLALERFDAA